VPYKVVVVHLPPSHLFRELRNTPASNSTRGLPLDSLGEALHNEVPQNRKGCPQDSERSSKCAGVSAPDFAEDAVQVASLRQQMDRQCKQRRFREPSASDYTTSQTYSQPLQASGGVKMEAESQPSDGFEAASVQAPDLIFAGPRSVFDVDAYPENGEHPPDA
jgi:hypothetical protein